MAFKFYAEEKKYPRDEGYQPSDPLQLSDYDKMIIKKRIEYENRKWVFDQTMKWIFAILLGLFIFKAMAG